MAFIVFKVLGQYTCGSDYVSPCPILSDMGLCILCDTHVLKRKGEYHAATVLNNRLRDHMINDNVNLIDSKYVVMCHRETWYSEGLCRANALP